MELAKGKEDALILDQLSVFSENKAGMLADIMDHLAEAGINVKALAIADTSEFGVLRFIVDAPKKALTVLKLGGFVASLTPVIAVKMNHEPGSLARIARALANADVSIEYLYACVANEVDTAFAILRVENNDVAVKLLTEKGYEAFKAL